MKLKNLPIEEVIKDPRYLMTLWNHFNYSIKDISSYEELTQEEKEIISPELFNKIIEPKRNSKDLILDLRFITTKLGVLERNRQGSKQKYFIQLDKSLEVPNVYPYHTIDAIFIGNDNKLYLSVSIGIGVGNPHINDIELNLESLYKAWSQDPKPTLQKLLERISTQNKENP